MARGDYEASILHSCNVATVRLRFGAGELSIMMVNTVCTTRMIILAMKITAIRVRTIPAIVM